MPSRVRFFLITPGATAITGSRALSLVRAVMGKDSGPWSQVNWKAVNAEGKRRGVWAILNVFRERRGIQRRASAYNSVAARHATWSPEDKALRQVARLALNRNPTRRIPPRLAEEPEGPPSTRIRPGIFA